MTTRNLESKKEQVVGLITAGETDKAETIMDDLGQRYYALVEAGYAYDHIWAEDIDDALEMAKDQFDADLYRSDETVWVRCEVQDVLNGDRESTTFTVDPPEPDCTCKHGHDWRSPYRVLGGLRENPGVSGHGGGAITKEVCRHCGEYRTTDTWAQNPETGEQGTSTSYEDPDEASRAYVARAAMNDAEKILDDLGYKYTRSEDDQTIILDTEEGKEDSTAEEVQDALGDRYDVGHMMLNGDWAPGKVEVSV